MKKIPFAKPVFDEDEITELKKVIESGFVGQGPKTKRFEEEFSRFNGTKYGIATNSGTTAIQIALLGIGLKNGDEVIVPSLSFVATGNAVIAVGGIPVFTDVDPETFNMKADDIEHRITERTKAIVPVHLLGIPCNLEKIADICKRYNLIMIEDCALACGGEYNGKHLGTIGDVSIYSFYGSKIITTGEGGMILTDNENYANTMKLLRSHGNNPEKKFSHLLLGYSYQLSDVCSAIGIAQIRKLPEIIEKRRINGKKLTEYLDSVKGIQIPVEYDHVRNGWFGFSILITDKSKSREVITEKLSKIGIETRPMYYVIPALSFYKRWDKGEKFPIAENVAKNGFFVSCSPQLSEEDIKYMGENIKIIIEES